MEGWSKAHILAAVCAAAMAAAVSAQERGAAIEQLPPADAGPVAQISDPAEQRASPAVAVQSAPQIASQAESARAEPQLTSERQLAPATAQLSTGPRTAQASQPLSRPSQGRTAETERVEGEDRCDPADEKSAGRASCERVVEARADEFDAPRAPELSPEQRLLLQQQMGDQASSANSAARRLAATGITDNSLESLGVASIVIGQGLEPAEDAKPPEKAAPDGAAAVVMGIINQIGGSPPPQ